MEVDILRKAINWNFLAEEKENTDRYFEHGDEPSGFIIFAYFLATCETVGLSRRTLLHGVV